MKARHPHDSVPLRTTQPRVEKEINCAEPSELNPLKAKRKSLLIALGAKVPKAAVCSAPIPTPVLPPPTPEQGKKIADAMREAISQAVP